MALKKAILVAMADEPPFDQISREIYPALQAYYSSSGYETFFVFGKSCSVLERRVRRTVEKLRWNRLYPLLRVYDFLLLNRYKWRSPAVKHSSSEIRVSVPEDLRHLSIKILHSLNYLVDCGYHIVVRTTVSSLLNPGKVDEVLNSIDQAQYLYAGRKISQSDGFSFISGSFTILNRLSVKKLFFDRNRLDYSLIDDVCFGKYFERSEVDPLDVPSFNISNINQVDEFQKQLPVPHIRCRTSGPVREDLAVMRKILAIQGIR